MNTKRVKIFLISLVFQFVISSLLYLGIKPPEILADLKIPLFNFSENALVVPQLSEIDPFEEAKSKLEQKTNTFSLEKKTNLVSVVSAAEGFEELSAYGVIDFDSGEVLTEKNLSQKLPIASLTKLMTAVVALDLASPDEIITVNYQGTTPEPSKLFLKEGEKYSLRDLLHFILISSANDGAEVIKEGINQKYSQKDLFVRAMNQKADFLGLKNSHFTNPQGFDNKYHYSSIEDLAILTHYALAKYPLIAEIVAKPFEDFREIEGDNRLYLNNWNGLLGIYPGIKGVKTGNTDAATHTNIVLSRRDGKQVLAILFGAPTILDRDLFSSRLLNLGFAKLGLESFEITEEQLEEKYRSWKRFD